MANLRELSELLDAIETAGFRGISGTDIADLLQSLAYVGGTMALKNGVSPDNDLTIVGGWNRCDALFDRSVDTQGVQDGVNDLIDPGAWYRIRAAGAGDWEFNAAIRITVDTAGSYDFRVAKNIDDGLGGRISENSAYMDTVSAQAGETIVLAVHSGLEKAMAGDNRLQPELRGPNGAIVTGISGQFGAKRG